MSTRMDEDDWARTLAVFRACLPRRGRKAEDDRRFLEARRGNRFVVTASVRRSTEEIAVAHAGTRGSDCRDNPSVLPQPGEAEV
jgi:hypothetical protein